MAAIHKAKDKVSQKAKRFSARLTSGLSSPSPPTVELAEPPAPFVTEDGADLSVPVSLQKGTEMLKISNKSQKRIVFRLDPDQGQIVYKLYKSVPIETIKEIRSGERTKYDRIALKQSEELEPRWLTIVYIIDGSYKTLHMIADTHDLARLWEISLRKLHVIRQGLMNGLGNVDLRRTIWERQYWKSANDGDQKLDVREVKALCRRLHVGLSDTELEKLVQEVDSGKQGYLDFQGFQKFAKRLKHRPELDCIYNELKAKSPNGALDYAAFSDFMVDTQQSPLSETELKSIFMKYCKIETFSKDFTMTLEQFSSFLLSPDNSAFAEHNKEISEDMTQPLSDYYISSSHNTYLVGHQLVGVSTVEGYVRALLHSCRSVELDIYDGEFEPMIYHGKTFTSKVPLRDICKAIAKYAFLTSPYPVIISAEVHCGVRQQDKMADIMSEIFGDTLVQAPVENRPKLKRLPSPEDLKHKILLKAKNQYVVAQLAALGAKHNLNQTQQQQHHTMVLPLNFTSSSDSSSTSSNDEKPTSLRKELKLKWQKFRGKTPSPGASSLSVVTDATRPITPPPTIGTITTPSASGIASKGDKQKMSLRLLALLVYTVGVKCHGVGREAAVTYEPEYMFSLSENAVNRLMKASGVLRGLIEHTQTNLVRIYPKGIRVNSTNYEPHRYWAAGAQVVAINWQTFDRGYTINQAMFQRNGRAGYVLKPCALRSVGDRLLSTRTRHFLDVRVISAQQLPRLLDSSGQEIMQNSIIDPFVEVTLHIPDWTSSPFLPSTESYKYTPASGPSQPSASTSAARCVSLKTSVIKNNGFNPVWQETLSIPFDCVGGPEGGMRDLIFVEFAVRHEGSSDDEDPIAIYCSPLSAVQFGYRHLPLYDMEYTQYMFSTLFIKSGIRNVD